MLAPVAVVAATVVVAAVNICTEDRFTEVDNNLKTKNKNEKWKESSKHERS